MSYEDDEFLERFREAMEYGRRRHESEVLNAAEQSLSQVSTAECPPPLTWHPYYRGKTHLLDWLNGVGDLASAGLTIKLPKLRPRSALFASHDEAVPVDVSFDVTTMTKQRAWGAAPWVGRPFHYEWYVGKDGLGRMIAGESHIVYDTWYAGMPAEFWPLASRDGQP